MISVIVTAFNRKEFLKSALESLVEQRISKNEFEVIVVKNFWDEACDEIIDRNNYRRVHPNSALLGEWISEGVRASKGDILCFLDDDDLFTNNKLRIVKELFIEDPELGYYHHHQSLIDKNGKDLPGHSFAPPSHMIKIDFPLYQNLRDVITSRHSVELYSLAYSMSCISVRKSVISTVLDYLSELNAGTDYFLLFAVLHANARIILFDPQVLSKYRVHRSNWNIYEGRLPFKQLKIVLKKQYTKDQQFLKIVKEMCNGDDFIELLNCRITELKLMSRIQLGPLKNSLKLNDYVHYISCLGIKGSRSFKNLIFRFLFGLGILFLPSIVGVFYHFYLTRLYDSNVYSEST